MRRGETYRHPTGYGAPSTVPCEAIRARWDRLRALGVEDLAEFKLRLRVALEERIDALARERVSWAVGTARIGRIIDTLTDQLQRLSQEG